MHDEGDQLLILNSPVSKGDNLDYITSTSMHVVF